MPSKDDRSETSAEISEEETLPIERTTKKKMKRTRKSKKRAEAEPEPEEENDEIEDPEAEEETEKGDRYFKLIDPETGLSFGRYTGDTPKQAASKGFTKMVQKLKKQKEIIPKHSIIYLRESTRGRGRKIYGYKATRVQLPKPQKLTITDPKTKKKKVIVYRYRNKIKKAGVPEDILNAPKINRVSKKTESSKTGGSKTAKRRSGSKISKMSSGSKSSKMRKHGSKKRSMKMAKKSVSPKIST